MSPTKWVVCCSKGRSVGTDDRDVTSVERGESKGVGVMKKCIGSFP